MSVDLSWIVEGLKKPGKTQAGIAKAIGRNPSVVTYLLQGKRELKAREIATIARYLEIDNPNDIAAPRSDDTLRLDFIRAARAMLASDKYDDKSARLIALSILQSLVI
jgi:transcriptional regulator with XRE-family HTH domain